MYCSEYVPFYSIRYTVRLHIERSWIICMKKYIQETLDGSVFLTVCTSAPLYDISNAFMTSAVDVTWQPWLPQKTWQTCKGSNTNISSIFYLNQQNPSTLSLYISIIHNYPIGITVNYALLLYYIMIDSTIALTFPSFWYFQSSLAYRKRLFAIAFTLYVIWSLGPYRTNEKTRAKCNTYLTHNWRIKGGSWFKDIVSTLYSLFEMDNLPAFIPCAARTLMSRCLM